MIRHPRKERRRIGSQVMSKKIVFTPSTEGVEMRRKKKGRNFGELERTGDVTLSSGCILAVWHLDSVAPEALRA
jgi:hypothetical protein